MNESVFPHVSVPIKTSQFKDDCEESIGLVELSRLQENENNELTSDDLEIPGDVLSELEAVSQLENFQGPTSHLKEYDMLVACFAPLKFPENINLNTLQVTKELKCRPRDVNLISKRVEKDEIGELSDDESVTDKNAEKRTVKCNDVVLSVAIFHPQNKKKNQEYLVLEYQKLTDLRDVIECPSDLLPIATPDMDTAPEINQLCKDVYKGGYFFIEGVFYNDTRDPLNRDLSRVVIEWAKSGSRYKSSRLGVFTSAIMEETSFEDLKIRLGYPYLYCHQGNCQHLIMFNDMRCADPSDNQNVSAYPLQTFSNMGRRKVCPVCETYTISWVTYNDMMAFEDPAFFCSKCFDSLHYGEDKKKLYDFEAYPYEDEIPSKWRIWSLTGKQAQKTAKYLFYGLYTGHKPCTYRIR